MVKGTARRLAAGPSLRVPLVPAVVGLLGLSATGCMDRDVPWRSPIEFDTARVVVEGRADTAALLVEVARTGEQRGFGLMVRPELDPGSGMLFLHDSIQPAGSGFWMWRTRMPLSIAFLDARGRIVAILEMPPCESPYQEDCPVYSPGVEYSSALEVNRGWFEERGLGIGDLVVVDSAGGALPTRLFEGIRQ